MPTALLYLSAKASEFSSTLNWLSDQFSSIPDFHNRHPHLQRQVDSQLQAARARLATLMRIVQLNSPALAPRGLSFVNQLQLDVYILSENYLPAIRNESEQEVQFGAVALAAARRCGLADVQEILASLSRGHAVLPVSPGCPLLFAPPHQRFTLLDLAAIYHEFGHIAFQKDAVIRDPLTKVVTDHFGALQQSVGFVSPAERAERLKQINRATEYWSVGRLNELFSDIFATHVVGPAHYYSCVDIAMRYSDDPYGVNIADVHPPFSARVTACLMTLPPEQQASDVGQLSARLWQGYVAGKPTNADFRLFCEDLLLGKLVTESVSRLVSLGYPQYQRTGYDLQRQPAANMNLEELLNDSVQMVFCCPAAYPTWEQPLVHALFA
jgi:hypothetical protein